MLRIHGLDDCDKVIVCDGFTVIDDKAKEYFKTSEIHQDTADKYLEYIDKVREKCRIGQYKHAHVHVQSKNCGFAENIRTALDQYVTTEFIMVVQHDQLFIKDLELEPLIRCMKCNDVINYIGFCADSSKNEVNCRLSGPQFKKMYYELEVEINQYISANNSTGGSSTMDLILKHETLPLWSLLGRRRRHPVYAPEVSSNSTNNSNSNSNHNGNGNSKSAQHHPQQTVAGGALPAASSPNLGVLTDNVSVMAMDGVSNTGDAATNSGDFNSDGALSYVCFRKDTTRDRSLVTHVILNYTTLRFGLPLMPLVFWYDKTHMSRSDFYRYNVLNNCEVVASGSGSGGNIRVGADGTMVWLGKQRDVHCSTLQRHSINELTGELKLKTQTIKAFIEDTFGVVHKTNIALYGLSYFHCYCSSYVYYDDFLSCSIKHANGRSFLTHNDKHKYQRGKQTEGNQITTADQAGGLEQHVCR